MLLLLYLAVALLVLTPASSNNSTIDNQYEDTCDTGPWSNVLEEWTLTASGISDRHGRVMALTPSTGYYVTDHPPAHPHYHLTPPSKPAGPHPYSEWHSSPQAEGPGKIVNRPGQGVNKEKPFKPSPSYAVPQNQLPQHQGSHHQFSNPNRGPGLLPPASVDRVDESPPRKEVTETDLYLLGAIEKLVYRVDLMEKRLRKLEENVHYLVVGTDQKPEPCVANFTRLGDVCYHFSDEPTDWKTANLYCRKLRANLLELDSESERRRLVATFLSDKRIRGKDIWTGGLNPGLLWIWSHSARPVLSNSSSSAHDANNTYTIVGEGRCLAFVYDPAANNYIYRGQDCSLRHRYVCEKSEDAARLGNEIQRVARALRRAGRGGRLVLAEWGAGAGAAGGHDTDTI